MRAGRDFLMVAAGDLQVICWPCWTYRKLQGSRKKTAGKRQGRNREPAVKLAASCSTCSAHKIRCVAVPVTVTGPLIYMTNPVVGARFWCNAGHRWRSQPQGAWGESRLAGISYTPSQFSSKTIRPPKEPSEAFCYTYV